MNTKQIEAAVTLSRTLNFRQAAEKLYISQPSLSYQIQTLEEEIGFTIFDRQNKSVSLTPAGQSFISSLIQIQEELKQAVETGRNMSSRYSSSLNICLPMRSCLYFLPQIMQTFQKEFPDVLINLLFIYDEKRIDIFLRKEAGLLFSLEGELAGHHGIKENFIYDSHIYLLTRNDNPLAQKEVVNPEDLKDTGYTLFIGGQSPQALKQAQNELLAKTNLSVQNSKNHENTLCQVAAGSGIALVPGFCNDHQDEFAWIPVSISIDHPMKCVLCSHADDISQSTKRFLEIARNCYEHADPAILF